MRILIAEDEKKTAAFLSQGLTESGFSTEVVHDGQKALVQALNSDFQLLILDAMLPGCDGWSVLSKLRGYGKAMPVLFLTARDSVADRVKGLELGADDYLVKPYAFSELLARVRALLRRHPESHIDVLRVADLHIDVLRRRAWRSTVRLELAPKEFSLLSLMTQRRGEVLSRRVLAEQVWDIAFEFDSNVVDVAVRRLRRKVDDPFSQKLIHTARGLGYVLEPR